VQLTNTGPTLQALIMFGGMGGNPAETLMREALEAAATDLAQICHQSGEFTDITILADSPIDALDEKILSLQLSDPNATFGNLINQFSQSLKQKTTNTDGYVYFGAGSGPLLDSKDIQIMTKSLNKAKQNSCITNNRYSADFFGIRPTNLLESLQPPPISDNVVPIRLSDESGTSVIEIPRSAKTQFNIDVPSDLATLSLIRKSGPKLEAFIAQKNEVLNPAARAQWHASQHFLKRDSEVFIYGRTSSRVWSYLETETACKIRIISEERGLKSARKGHQARSILAYLIQAYGPQEVFCKLLPQFCSAAFVDLIPIIEHMELACSRSDRFSADLFQHDNIENELLREIIVAITESPIPIALGGHSLVGSSLEILNQLVWDVADNLIPNPMKDSYSSTSKTEL